MAQEHQDDFALRVIELTATEFAADRDYITRSHDEWQRGIHQLVLLAAGIGGVVVPVLANRSEAGSALLREGTLYLFASVGIGVVMQLIGRYALAGLMALLHKEHRARIDVLARIASSQNMEELAAANKRASPRRRAILALVIGVATLLSELAFYGCFLWGASRVAFGFIGER